MSTLTPDTLTPGSSPPSDQKDVEQFVGTSARLLETRRNHDTGNSRTTAHRKRLKKLRRELDYLAETAWMYPSIETMLGQN